jgi:hypothetical protein
MRARSSAWLLLALMVLAALLAAELRFEAGVGSQRQSIGRASAPSAASPAPLFALADRESFSETLTRPLFMPNRRPADTESAPALPAPRAATPNTNRYVLSAIIIVDDERIALLTDTATGALSRVREGESLAGWQVEEIREDGAVLTNGDTREELSLRTFGAPVLVPRSSKRRAADASNRPPGNDAQALPKRPRRPKRGPRQSVQIPRTSGN